MEQCDNNSIRLMFALVRETLGGNSLSDKEKSLYSPEILPELIRLSKQHDIAHLVVQGLTENGLLNNEERQKLSKLTMTAIYRVTTIDYELKQLCSTLENAQIPFTPLKGSVLRKYYPEPWMRTSCDIDILVPEDEAERIAEYLVNHCEYSREGKGSHDISLFSPGKVHIELHYDLVEDGIANKSSEILKSVWDRVVLKEGKQYWYEMPDELFYFYHIAHMAKHFENGGCGIRTFIDLQILDHLPNADVTARKQLLEKGGLLRFAECSQKLSRVWLDGESHDEISQKTESYVLHGGVYGSVDNRVLIQNLKRGGRFRYMISRAFIPYDVIKFHYPILLKHRWLTPIMEVRRWFKLIFCGRMKRVKYEMSLNANVTADQAEQSKKFLKDIGLQ